MPITAVQQVDTSSKRIFVLCVYASAEHARWVADDDKTIKALAVTSEPEILWRGTDAGAIIEQIPVPPGPGRLVAAATVNGSSGVILDSLESCLSLPGSGRQVAGATRVLIE